MLGNRYGTNEKPRLKVAASSQGRDTAIGIKEHKNFTTELKGSRSRHDKGMELYKSGRVSIGSNGLFKVSGYYDVDTERMTCTCPDYKTRKEPCKHIYAACLFVKNRGKQKIEHLDGNGKNQGRTDTTLKEPANKPVEAPKQADNKGFDRQATITRLAVLNTATEILKTHRKPIEFSDIVSLAGQLEKWALGN